MLELGRPRETDWVENVCNRVHRAWSRADVDRQTETELKG